MTEASARSVLLGAVALLCLAWLSLRSGLQRRADVGATISRIPVALAQVRGVDLEQEESERRARIAGNPWVAEYEQNSAGSGSGAKSFRHRWDAAELRLAGYIALDGDHAGRDAFEIENTYKIRERQVTVDPLHGVEVVRHVPVVGCGGTFRPFARSGDRVEIRYVAEVRTSENKVPSSSPALNVSFVMGAPQPFVALQNAIGVMCPGELAELVIPLWLLRILPGAQHVPSYIKRMAASSPRRGASMASQLHVFVEVLSTARAHESLDEFEEAQILASRIVAVGAEQGESCDAACARKSASCLADAFKIVNECPRIKSVFPCTVCEVAAKGSAGPDMPCYVSPLAPLGHPRGFCMSSPNVAVSECAGKYPHTSRICPCEPLLVTS